MKKILAVDDSQLILTIMHKAIEGAGYMFASAKNGQEAIDKLAQDSNFTLILMDWNMPVMNGYDALVAIKANPATAHIPVMMVTTESEKESVVKAIQAGAANYTVKPFTLEDLVGKIQQVLG